MSVKANKALIGAFVLAALALAVAGVALFGTGKLFVPQKKYVMYFETSVKGLSVGAPVVFRGVKIGSVKDISLKEDIEDMTVRIPVVAQINMNKFQMSDKEPEGSEYLQDLIERGLRAQLQYQSMVTGQRMIGFDFHPGTPVRFVSDAVDYPQIPTIQSTAGELTETLEELPIKQLVERTNALVGGLERMVNSPDMQDAPRTLNLAAADARMLIEKIDREVGLLSADARETLNTATATLEQADRVLTFEEGPPAELMDNINLTLANTRKTLDKFDSTLDVLRSAVPDERSKYQLRKALRELEETSIALGSLIEYLNRHPEALLRGKPDLEKK